jgi:hypothetical protein
MFGRLRGLPPAYDDCIAGASSLWHALPIFESVYLVIAYTGVTQPAVCRMYGS